MCCSKQTFFSPIPKSHQFDSKCMQIFKDLLIHQQFGFIFCSKTKALQKNKTKQCQKNETKTLLCLVRIEMYLRYSHAKEPLDVVGLEFCRLLMLLCFVYSPTSFFNVIASQFSHSFDDVAFHAETDATLCIHHQVMTANSEILPLYFDFILFSNLQLLLCSKSVLII